MGRFQHKVPYTWELSWLAVEKPWSALDGPFLFFLIQTDIDKASLPLYIRGSISGTVDSFQSGDGWRALTIVSLVMSGRGRGHEP